MSGILGLGKKERYSRFRTYYILSFIIGTIAFLVLLYVNAWDLTQILNSTTLITLLTISGSVMKFMGGIGIALTYASIGGFVFRQVSDTIRGNKTKAQRMKMALTIPLVVIIIYAGWKLYDAFFATGTLSLLEILITLYGVWSLLLTVYLIPVVKSEYNPEYEESRIDAIKKRFGALKFSLWKGYQTHIYKEHGKVYAAEFQKYADRINGIRMQLSGIMLLPTCFMLLIFPPLAFPVFILSLRVFTIDDEPLVKAERGLLVLAVLILLGLSTAVFLLIDTTALLFYFDLAYGIGLIMSAGLVTWIMTTS